MENGKGVIPKLADRGLAPPKLAAAKRKGRG